MAEDVRIAGCVALRELDNEACEMKRMFVSQQLHGRGVGQALAQAIIQRAKDLGYDARHRTSTARSKGLYRKFGFRDVEPYYDLSIDRRSRLVFRELDLTS